MLIKILWSLCFLFAAFTMASYLFPQINFRQKPSGLCEAKLKDHLDNWVSSKVPAQDRHYIQPLTIQSLELIAKDIKKNQPNVIIVEANDKRILAYRQSRIYHFTDWVCLESTGDITSSATMGRKDFGMNRALVESIRSLIQP